MKRNICIECKKEIKGAEYSTARGWYCGEDVEKFWKTTAQEQFSRQNKKVKKYE